MSKKQKESDLLDLKDALLGVEHVRIEWCSGNPTSTGRTDRYVFLIWDPSAERPEYAGIRDISYLVGEALGYRVSRDGHITLGGCGYDKAHELAGAVSRAAGVSFRCTGAYCGCFGPDGEM